MKNLFSTCAVLALAVGSVQARAQATGQSNANAATTPAQTEPDQAAEDKNIVVTGTLIRGIAPAGTETIMVTQQNIQESGALTTNDVLAKIPQLSFFGRPSNQGNNTGVGRQQGVDQPSVHGLPTLILLDGHRVASAGAGGSGAATSIDPSIIPTGILRGIEIVPDGGAALYGSDAVGGVLNFTTIKRFDGLKLDGAVSGADNYRAYRGNATVGKDWGTGSIFGSYSYYKANGLTGADRPYIEQFPKIETCFPATVATSGVKYSYSSIGANGKPTAYTVGASTCSRYANESVLPAQRQHSGFAGLSQDLNSAIHVDLRAFYSSRKTTSLNTSSIVIGARTIPKTNPFYTPTPAEVLNPALTQTAAFSLFPAVGSLPQTTKLDTWGTTAEFKADVGANFQVRLLGNYNQSIFNAKEFASNDATLLGLALARTDPTTALDPYNVAATPGSILVAQQIANSPTFSRGRIEQTQGRLVTDGTLFRIPGGDVKIAAGGEVLHESFNSSSQRVDNTGTQIAGSATRLSASRTVYSVFGELEVPVISPENNGPIYELRLSAAGRFDHYSDFGDTFNPRFAVSLLPVEWLTLRGTYGHSFVAPALPQLFTPQVATLSTTAFILPAGALNALLLTGGNANLKPQKAKTWSLGLDLKLPFAKGLRAGVTYYNVHFTDRLGSPPFTSVATFYTPTYAAFFIQNPTYAQALAFIGANPPATITTPLGPKTLEQLFPGPSNGRVVTGVGNSDSPYYISSGRFENIASENDEGIDFDVSYTQPTSFGSLNFGVAGNYLLTKETAAGAGTFVDSLLTESKFKGTASIGANVENFRFSGTLLHTSGYRLPVNTTTQTRVSAYDTVDAYLGYTFKNLGFLNDTVVSLQVTNLFDVRPPVVLTASTGRGFGSILGRLIQVGLNTKF